MEGGGGDWQGGLGKCEDGWAGHLTPACHPSLVKVDKDRQMVVLEEEFQVRGWGGWDPKKYRVGEALGDPRDWN